MARGDQLARQWIIIQILSSSGSGRSAAELAQELGCSSRTVYRDLEALQFAGFPVYNDQVDGKHVWSLLDSVKHQVPIPFSLTELMALYFTWDLSQVFKGTVFYDSLASLFQKIKTSLPQESVQYLQSVEQVLHVGLRPYKEYGTSNEIINKVNEAATKKKSVEIVYFTMGRKSKSRRMVDPYRIWFFNGTFYLIGHCHTRGEVRTFALDRIEMLDLTEQAFEVPEDFSLDEFLKPSFGIIGGKPEVIRVRFDPHIAGYVKEKVWHESQNVILQKDGSIIFEVEVAPGAEIKSWIMSWGDKAEVLEPELLRGEIQSAAAAMLEKYRGSTKQETEPHTA